MINATQLFAFSMRIIPARKTLLNVGRLTAILTEKVLKSSEISVIQNFVSISV